MPVTEPAVQAAAAIVRNAATKQGGLAQLYADLAAVVAQPNAAVPRPVAAAIAELFGVRVQASPDDGVDASDIRTALARSGLPAGDAAPIKDQPFSKAADLGSLLSTLRQTLKSWADSEANVPAAKLAQAAPAALQVPAKSAALMPPYRNGPTIAQALASPLLPMNASPREQALYLLDKTDAATARQTLMQIASLPDQSAPGVTRPGSDATRLTFDIPLATAQGTAVAQVRIERDGKNSSDPEAAPVWRASFSVDVEPIGPVHVRIAQVNGKTTVALTAERAESAASLKADLANLESGLRGAELEPGSISCRSGMPTAPSALPGMFVDQPT